MIEVILRGQLSPPLVVHNYRCAEFRSMHDSLNFATIPHALAHTLCEEKIDSTFLIAIAAL